MEEYTPDESIDVLVDRIRSADVSERNKVLLIQFKDWLADRKSPDEVACLLYVWYDLLPSIEFALDTATETQVRGLLERAPGHSEELYREAVNLFYVSFLGAEDVLEG